MSVTNKTSLDVSSASGEAVGIASTGDLSKNTFGDVDISTTSATGTAYGLKVADEGNVALNGTTNSIAAQGAEGYGITVSGAELTLSGNTTVTGNTVGMTVDDTSSVTVSEGANLSTNSMENTGTITLDQNAALSVSGKAGDSSKLGKLTGTDATITLGAGTFAAQSIRGSGNTLVFNNLAATESVSIEDASDLSIVATGNSNDTYANADAAFKDLTDKVKISEGTGNVYTVREGAVNDGVTATQNPDGTWVKTVQKNEKLEAFNTVAAMATMAWRHDMNDLTKRMGELRDSPTGIGGWVRFYGSNQEYGRLGVTSKSNSVQVGSDYDVGNHWKMGGAFTYTDGSSSYDAGSADSKAYGLAAYGSWLADNGAFVDLIGKYSRLSNDFSLNTMNGSSKNNAFSASAELGWHIPFAELAFIEPQAELTYGIVLGDNFTTSNGVKIDQDDTEALIGRLGLRGGSHFPDKKGTVYVRASVLHDFKGESEFTATLASNSSVRNTVKDDLGGTYYEIGVGANFNWTQNAYSYVDLERQNGGDVKENWRWNVGFRYVW